MLSFRDTSQVLPSACTAPQATATTFCSCGLLAHTLPAAAGLLCALGCPQVKVLWVVNAVEKNWEAQLPKEVRDALNGSRKKKGGLYAKEESAKDAAPEDKDAKGEGGVSSTLGLTHCPADQRHELCLHGLLSCQHYLACDLASRK